MARDQATRRTDHPRAGGHVRARGRTWIVATGGGHLLPPGRRWLHRHAGLSCGEIIEAGPATIIRRRGFLILGVGVLRCEAWSRCGVQPGVPLDLAARGSREWRARGAGAGQAFGGRRLQATVNAGGAGGGLGRVIPSPCAWIVHGRRGAAKVGRAGWGGASRAAFRWCCAGGPGARGGMPSDALGAPPASPVSGCCRFARSRSSPAGTACGRLAHPWRTGLRPLNFPSRSDLPAAGEGARRAAVPVRLGPSWRGCRLPVSFAFSGDGAPAAPWDRLRLQGGVHNACALRRLPPGSPVPARACGHRAKNSGRRRPAPDAWPMRSGTLSRGAPNLGIRQGSLSFFFLQLHDKGNANDCDNDDSCE